VERLNRLVPNLAPNRPQASHLSALTLLTARPMRDGDGDLTGAGIFVPPRVHPIEMPTMGSTRNNDKRQKGE
jgi:hypothetical protein